MSLADCTDAQARHWPADKVERRPVEALIPHARNAKRHPPEQVEQLAASIRAFGFTVPVLAAEDGTIIAGHGRVLAAQKLGLTEVPVIVARGWSEEQKRAYRIADNKLAENAEWDDELLRIELSELRDGGFDLDLTGFDPEELEAVLDGWQSDIEQVSAAGKHTDGITRTIKVTVAQADADAATAVIREALDAAGIEYTT